MAHKRKSELREKLVENFGDDLMFADTFDGAIIGVATGRDSELVVYNARQMVEILLQEENLAEEDAWEYLEFNTFCAYIGKNSPIYVEGIDNEC